MFRYQVVASEKGEPKVIMNYNQESFELANNEYYHKLDIGYDVELFEQIVNGKSIVCEYCVKRDFAK